MKLDPLLSVSIILTIPYKWSVNYIKTLENSYAPNHIRSNKRLAYVTLRWTCYARLTIGLVLKYGVQLPLYFSAEEQVNWKATGVSTLNLLYLVLTNSTLIFPVTNLKIYGICICCRITFSHKALVISFSNFCTRAKFYHSVY